MIEKNIERVKERGCERKLDAIQKVVIRKIFYDNFIFLELTVYRISDYPLPNFSINVFHYTKKCERVVAYTVNWYCKLI